jgi:hypothetical protein
MTMQRTIKELAMNQHIDFTTIDQHIRRARLQQSAALGNLIGTGLARAWQALVGLYAATATKAAELAQSRSVTAARPSTAASH